MSELNCILTDFLGKMAAYGEMVKVIKNAQGHKYLHIQENRNQFPVPLTSVSSASLSLVKHSKPFDAVPCYVP